MIWPLTVTVIALSLFVLWQSWVNRDLRRQLAEAEEDIEELEAARGHGDVRIREVQRHG